MKAICRLSDRIGARSLVHKQRHVPGRNFIASHRRSVRDPFHATNASIKYAVGLEKLTLESGATDPVLEKLPSIAQRVTVIP